MTRDELLQFMRSEKYAVQTSVSPGGAPQAAVVGIAVSDHFEIVFDTLSSSRKAPNLRANPAIAFVIGGTRDGDERTVQCEGIADEPSGGELDRLLAVYYATVSRRTRTARMAWIDLRARQADLDSIQQLQRRPAGDRRVRSGLLGPLTLSERSP